MRDEPADSTDFPSSPEPDALSFDRVDEAPRAPGCQFCEQPLEGKYFEVNGAMCCGSCAEQARTALVPRGSRTGRFLRAAAGGAVAALLGALLWFGIGKLTGYEFSLIAIVIGWMVGKAVRWGSGHRGGWRYQVLAMALTYLSIVSTYIPQLVEGLSLADEEWQEAGAAEGDDAALAAALSDPAVEGQLDGSAAEAPAAGSVDLALLAEASAEPPPTDSVGEPAPNPVVSVLVATVVLFGFAIALPFLAGFENILGLVIIAIGLYQAWTLNRKARIEVSGPFELAPAGADPG